jgi:hypothetical protein
MCDSCFKIIPEADFLQVLPSFIISYHSTGRALAQAISLWLPTAAARVSIRAACGVCGGQSVTGAAFLRVLRVSPANHSTNFSIIITRGWRNSLLTAAVPSGPNWTPPLTITTKKLYVATTYDYIKKL